MTLKSSLASNQRPSVLPVGMAGYAVQFSDQLNEPANRAALAFRDAVERANWSGVEECSTSLCSAFVRFDPLAPLALELPDLLTDLLQSQDWYSATLPDGRRHFEIPCVFGGTSGPQLEDAAAAAGMTAQDAVTSLSQARTRVLTIGFAPGQPYAGLLDPAWDIPRLSEITPSVPQGALVVAVRQLIVFANTTPTGWRHIGQTAFKCFDASAAEPFALRPGDELSFRPVTRDEMDNIKRDPKAGNGGARIEVLT